MRKLLMDKLYDWAYALTNGLYVFSCLILDVLYALVIWDDEEDEDFVEEEEKGHWPDDFDYVEDFDDPLM